MEILACKPVQVTVINVISKLVYNVSKAAFQIRKKNFIINISVQKSKTVLVAAISMIKGTEN